MSPNCDDPARRGDLLREGEPGGDRHDAALNAVTEELRCAEVLAAAKPGTRARIFAEHLRHEPVDVVRPGQIVAMTAVIRHDHVAPAVERGRQAHGG